MRNFRVCLPVTVALRAKVFEPEVLPSVWIIDDFAWIEFPGRRCDGQRVCRRASPSGLEAPTAVVCDGYTGRAVAGIAVKVWLPE
jgi:hypothetical protein